MPLVASIDYSSPPRIYLSSDTVGADVDTMDVYREIRALRRTVATDRNYRPVIIGGGNVTKTLTTKTPSFVQLLYGCRIVPFDTSSTIRLIRETFTDDNLSGADVFDLAPLTPGVAVNILVEVPQVEIVEVATGGTDPEDVATAVWAIVLESGITMIQAMRAIFSGNANDVEVTGNQSVLKSADGLQDRVTATTSTTGRAVTARDLD